MKKTYSIRLEEIEFEKARRKFGSAIVYRCFNAVCRGLLLAPDKILFELLGAFMDNENKVIEVCEDKLL